MESEIKEGDYIAVLSTFPDPTIWGIVLRVEAVGPDKVYPLKSSRYDDEGGLLFARNEVRPATDVEVLKAKLEGLV